MTVPANDQNETRLTSPTSRNWVWLLLQAIMRVVFLVWLRYRAHGTEHIPAEGGGLVIVNHQSFLDPMLVGLPLTRPVSYLARDSLFPLPIIGWILRNTYVMPISREAASSASIREAVRRMKHGFLVGLFPEGTRTEDGEVGEFKPGFVALARRVKLPIYPVGIAGAHEAYPKGAYFMRPGQVHIVFGEPVSAEVVAELTQRGREDEFVGLIRNRVIDCLHAAEQERRLALGKTAE